MVKWRESEISGELMEIKIMSWNMAGARRLSTGVE